MWIFSTDFSQRISNNKFEENPFSGSSADTCGLTDGHDEVNGRFSRLCEERLKRKAT
jgi:hypothetical protein